MAKPIRLQSSENDWTPLPEGTYDCQITAVESKTSKNGYPQLEISLEIVDGPKKGRKPKKWYTMTEKAGVFLRRLIDELDVSIVDHGKTESGDLDWEFDADDLVGRVVRYDVTIRDHEGKKQNEFANETVSEFDPFFSELKAARGGDVAQAAAPASAPVQTAAPAPSAATQARRRTPTAAVRR